MSQAGQKRMFFGGWPAMPWKATASQEYTSDALSERGEQDANGKETESPPTANRGDGER